MKNERMQQVVESVKSTSLSYKAKQLEIVKLENNVLELNKKCKDRKLNIVIIYMQGLKCFDIGVYHYKLRLICLRMPNNTKQLLNVIDTLC